MKYFVQATSAVVLASLLYPDAVVSKSPVEERRVFGLSLTTLYIPILAKSGAPPVPTVYIPISDRVMF